MMLELELEMDRKLPPLCSELTSLLVGYVKLFTLQLAESSSFQTRPTTFSFIFPFRIILPCKSGSNSVNIVRMELS